MRLFIAFPLDGQAAEEAFQWELWLKGRCRQGSFPPKEHLHVTAAFLGECSPWQCTQAKEFVSQFSFFPIPIRFFRWECFHRDTYGCALTRQRPTWWWPACVRAWKPSAFPLTGNLSGST